MAAARGLAGRAAPQGLEGSPAAGALTTPGPGPATGAFAVPPVLSIAIPIAFVAYADHVKQTTGVNWLGALGALVAVSIVIATTVIARRA